jgi:hypothetical protein
MAFAFASGAVAQTQAVPAQQPSGADSRVQAPGIAVLDRRGPASSTNASQPISPVQPLLDFRDSDVKFNIETLMSILRDNRHEGWVLAAYPDPKTSRPLIGAGFSLDLPAREHAQQDPLNPAQFLEPSSAQLWEAAGLEPARLETMLAQYDRELSAWKKKKFRRKIRRHDLFPEIGEDDAMKLLRISTIQAIHNAGAYCRNFDQLTGPQQMALTQLVFQMGVNLEEFTQFLFAINHRMELASAAATASPAVTPASLDSNPRSLTTFAGASPNGSAAQFESLTTPAGASPLSDPEYWHAVQGTLIHSDWARRYSMRAISVIAMFDPAYEAAPWAAEAKVRAEVHPLHTRRRRAAVVRTASARRHKNTARRTRKS